MIKINDIDYKTDNDDDDVDEEYTLKSWTSFFKHFFLTEHAENAVNSLGTYNVNILHHTLNTCQVSIYIGKISIINIQNVAIHKEMNNYGVCNE